MRLLYSITGKINYKIILPNKFNNVKVFLQAQRLHKPLPATALCNFKFAKVDQLEPCKGAMAVGLCIR